MAKKRRILLASLRGIIKGLWKLMLLCIYTAARAVEIIASFLGKLIEKLLNPK